MLPSGRTAAGELALGLLANIRAGCRKTTADRGDNEAGCL
jgi:hypothetical protein